MVRCCRIPGGALLPANGHATEELRGRLSAGATHFAAVDHEDVGSRGQAASYINALGDIGAGHHRLLLSVLSSGLLGLLLGATLGLGRLMYFLKTEDGDFLELNLRRRRDGLPGVAFGGL